MVENVTVQIAVLNKDIELVKERIAHEKELNTLSSQGVVKALELQAKEYERRLGILNNEATKLATMQATYMPREVYESEKKESDSKLQTLIEWRSNMQGRMVAAGFVWTIIMAVIFFLLRKL